MVSQKDFQPARNDPSVITVAVEKVRKLNTKDFVLFVVKDGFYNSPRYLISNIFTFYSFISRNNPTLNRGEVVDFWDTLSFLPENRLNHFRVNSFACSPVSV